MPRPSLIFVYVPCRDVPEAQRIAQAMVEQRLAACGNIIPSIQSVYIWEGEVRHETEAVLILKTTRDNFNRMQAVVQNLHSYDTPCIAALNVSDVNDACHAWVCGNILPH